MTQITDLAMLKHHRVDYGAQIGEPTRRSRKPLNGGLVVVLLALLALSAVTGMSA